jgi:alkanesulfonate monooxygenase SsuD/methylene tetrahydromethanopterin reductase-like flavin-dependent oxidoreductase (luciferase family)
VHSIRSGAGAIPFPRPETAATHPWTDEARAVVADRIETQFVGSPATVADRLQALRDVVDADELLVTTITHDHADRVASYALLAQEWSRRGAAVAS